jgi:Holliday junction resolvase RusA-like endonuclease
MYPAVPDCFSKQHFERGRVIFSIPVSEFAVLGSSGDKKRAFAGLLRVATKQSDYVFTSRLRISVDIYQSNYLRLKNPNAYDIDNLGKPILDALSGFEGLFVDDSLIERVIINWINSCEQKIEVEIDAPVPGFQLKSEAAYVRFGSWCFPFSKPLLAEHRDSLPGRIKAIRRFFEQWNSIRSDEDFEEKQDLLPIGTFIASNKLRDRGFDLYDLDHLEKECMSMQNSVEASSASHNIKIQKTGLERPDIT